MSMFKLYGIVVGVIAILVGLLSVFYQRFDSSLSSKQTSVNEIKQKRIVLGIALIIAGLLSLSAVLFGWPPVRGYIVAPN